MREVGFAAALVASVTGFAFPVYADDTPSPARSGVLVYRVPQSPMQGMLKDAHAPAFPTEALYLNALCSGIDKIYKDKTVGYQVVAMMPDGSWCGVDGGMARRAPDTAPRAMTYEDKIAIASVSKTITAAALLRAMAERKISIDSEMAYFLPDNWVLGPNINTISFRELLTHTSGIRCGDKGLSVSYADLQTCIHDGISLADKKTQAYRNENFGLMRILLPRVLTKPVELAPGRQLKFGEADDIVQPKEKTGQTVSPTETLNVPGLGTMRLSTWGAADYASFYITYVNTVVFKPIGLPRMYCKPTDANPALSYKSATADQYDFSVVQNGQDWGDMTLLCGSEGWNMSAHQLAIFMHGLTQTSDIVPGALMARMEKEGLGLDAIDFGGGLKSWFHSGYYPASANNGELNTLIAAFSNGVSVGMIINSPFKDQDYFTPIANVIKSLPPIQVPEGE